MDFEPRQLTVEQTESLRRLSRQVLIQLELRRKLTAQVSLSRQEANRQISLVLSTDKYKVIKRFALATTGTVRNNIESPLPVQPQAQQEFSERILGSLTGSDYDFRNQSSEVEFIAPTGSTIFDLRETWKAGLIDHFTIEYIANGDPTPTPHFKFNRNTQKFESTTILTTGCPPYCIHVQVGGTIKDDLKSSCPPQSGIINTYPTVNGLLQTNVSPFALFCDMLVAERKVDEVTGITSVFEQDREINCRVRTGGSNRCWAQYYQSNKNNNFGTHHTRTLFVLYDDGWRIAQILD
jgi:hypothetical protein